MDCGIVVSESRYYIHFLANTLGKGMNPPYPPPSYGLNSTITVLLGENCFSILKLYLHLTELLHTTAWIDWNGDVFDN